MPEQSDKKANAEKPARILCVDDERNVLRALERLFIEDEYEIVACMSGEEGLKELESGGIFQVVISDYRMPGMNGVEFLRQVYARRPETVRIVLSGYADTGAIVDAINHGHIYKFIPKPWNDDDLRITINNALEHYRLRRENDELMRQLQDSNYELSLLNSNLEHMVRERTKSLEVHNRALSVTQSVLDNLPVAVMGVDSNCMVIQCNRACHQLLTLHEGEILGANCLDLLPGKLLSLINEGVANGSTYCEPLEVAGKMVRIVMKSFTMLGNKSYVLTFHPEET